MFYFFNAVVPVSWKTQIVHDCFENAGLVMVTSVDLAEQRLRD